MDREELVTRILPVAFLLIFGLIHRSLRTRGFLLKSTRFSTDNAVSLILFMLIHIWTVWALPTLRLWDSHLVDNRQTFRHLISMPLIALVFSWCWLITWLTTNYDGTSYTWRMDCSNGPFGWRESLQPWFRQSMYGAIGCIIPLCIVAMYLGHIVQGMLTIAACVMFLTGSFAFNHYIKSPHRYAGNMLRVMLPTSHIEGTVYILPSSQAGFTAVWSPKVEAEHRDTDGQMMALFASMRTGHYSLSEPLRRLRVTLSSYNERCILSNTEVTTLAEWLLVEPGAELRGKPLHALRPSNVHLIGRDLMFALAHAEYLVFMRKDKIPPYLRNKLGHLREIKRSGGLDGGIPDEHTIGYKNGMEGYQEAVKHVYSIFGEPIDEAALNPSIPQLPQSVALGRKPTSTEDYVASLWTICLEHSESTFSALYMFCCVWFIEGGNSGGFHIFPLRCESQVGDRTAWQIIWRQGWFEAIQAQMIASSSLFATGFAAGVLP